MRITQLRIHRFRSYRDACIALAPSLTLFLGENNVGKSAAMLALTKLLTQQMTTTSDQIDSGDFWYGQRGDLAIIEAHIELTDGERDEILIAPLVDLASPAQSEPALAERLKQQGNEIVLFLKRPLWGIIPAPLLRWGDLSFLGDRVWLGARSDYEAAVRAGQPPHISWQNLASRVAHLPLMQPADLPEPAVIDRSFVEGLGRFLLEHFKVVREFRTTSAGSRTEATESLGGSDTASVLLNLKNHRDHHERKRYQQIVAAFHRLYPRFEIEAVEKEPGKATPEIQFLEQGRANPVSLAYVSAGVHQVLTLLTNLIGREGLVISNSARALKR